MYKGPSNSEKQIWFELCGHHVGTHVHSFNPLFASLPRWRFHLLWGCRLLQGCANDGGSAGNEPSVLGGCWVPGTLSTSWFSCDLYGWSKMDDQHLMIWRGYMFQLRSPTRSYQKNWWRFDSSSFLFEMPHLPSFPYLKPGSFLLVSLGISHTKNHRFGWGADSVADW